MSTWTTGSEAEFRAIWEAAEDGLIINDYDSGTVVEANPAFCRMHGYEPGAMNGLDPTTFIYEGHLGLLAQFQEDVRAGKAFRTRALDVRRDGTLFWVHVSGTQSVFRGKPVLLAVVRDITAEVEAEQILERRVAERTQELSTLLEVTRQVGATLDFEALAPLILDQLRHVIAYSRAALFGLEEDGLVLLQAADGDASPPVRRRAGAHAPTASFGVLWAGISSGETVIVDDLASEPALWEACVRALGDSAAGGTLVAAPLTVLGAPAGMLVAFAENPGTFTHRHADLLRAFAGQAAVALGNARMHEQAQSAAVIEERQRLARELHDSVSQALYGIALGSRTARDLLSRNPESAREPMEYVLSLAETGLAEMRARSSRCARNRWRRRGSWRASKSTSPRRVAGTASKWWPCWARSPRSPCRRRRRSTVSSRRGCTTWSSTQGRNTSTCASSRTRRACSSKCATTAEGSTRGATSPATSG
ncbi:MAG: PAS domain S-box protein [Thermoflexaceae bacterium]|nr:PAS domain S-box protein [Thermoflexaceae bacterium]